MLASSPSPSAALRPASSSSPSHSRPHSSFSHSSSHHQNHHHPSSSSSARKPDPSSPRAPAAHYCHYEPARTSSVVIPPNSQLSPRSSRVAVEELRSALTRHTVESSPYGPSGDLPRGRTSAGMNSLGGASHANGSHPGASNPTNDNANHNNSNHNHNSNLSLSHPPGPPSTTAAAPTSPSASSAVPTAPVPPPQAPISSAPSVPSVTSTSGSNKRNSRDDNMANSKPEEQSAQSGSLDREGSQSKRLRPSKPDVKVLPKDYDQADPRDIVVLISSMLMELIRFNDKIPLHQGRLTRFHSRSPPRISVHDYLQRLTTHATLSPPILLSMVYYIDRLCALYPAFNVSSLTIHRFLISSATVASKGLSDSFWTNKTYARVGGISLTELALLELEFLFRVEWRIVPQPEVLVDYYQSLIERCDGYEIKRD